MKEYSEMNTEGGVTQGEGDGETHCASEKEEEEKKGNRKEEKEENDENKNEELKEEEGKEKEEKEEENGKEVDEQKKDEGKKKEQKEEKNELEEKKEKEELEEGEEDEERFVADVLIKSRVPDGGWGWLVALGTFIINVLLLSLSFCFGVLFFGFLLERGVSSTLIAWIYNLFLVLGNVSMILTNPLCQEFGQRIVGFVSVFLASLSIALSGFSPSVYFLFFSYSLIGGVSGGLGLGIAYMVLPPYFNKKAGKANTFLVAGAPASQMLMAPLIRYLLEVYAIRGAALIVSAVMLNGLIAVSLFHPVEWHLKPLSGKNFHAKQDALQGLLPRQNTSLKTFNNMRLKDLPQVDCSLPKNRSLQKLQRSRTKSLSSRVSAESDVPGGITYLSDETEESITQRRPQGSKSIGKTLLRVAGRIRSDLTVLRQLRCVILAVTLLMTQTTYFNFIMMLPFIAQSANHTLGDAANCIALMGVINLVARLVVSPLADWKRFSIRVSIMLGYLLRASGIIVSAMAFDCAVLWQFRMTGVVYGLGLGFSLSMFNLVIVKYMGIENLKPTIGVLGLLSAVSYLTLGPLIGAIRDSTNSYLTSLCVMAALDLISVAMWFLMPAAQARDTRTQLRQKTSIEASRP